MSKQIKPREIVTQISSALNIESMQPLKKNSLRSSVHGAWTKP
jgi:hypothetical protein